ncbi:MAG: AAA family ATPase [Halobacteriaceae archaeon]
MTDADEGGRVIAVASGKGGVGKTTTALAVAACAAGAGREAVVADADLGMANVGTTLAVPDGATVHDVLADRAEVADAIRDGPDGYDVLPGSEAVEDYAAIDPEALHGVVETLREQYDVVVLDTGAGLSNETVLPTAMADETVVVTTDETAAVRDAAKTAAIVDRVDGAVTGAVVTRASADRADDVADELGVDLVGFVPEDDAVPDAIAAHDSVVGYAPESPAARAYCDLTADLLGVAVTDIDVGGHTAEEGGVAAAAIEERDDEERGGLFGRLNPFG